MKKELIQEFFQQFEQARYLFNDIECWSARELQEILGYAKWDNFIKVIEKAKNACLNSGIAVSDHFPDIRKMIHLYSKFIKTNRLKGRTKNIWLLSENNGTFAHAFEQWFVSPLKKQVTLLTIIHLPGLPPWQHTWGVFSFKGGDFGIQ